MCEKGRGPVRRDLMPDVREVVSVREKGITCSPMPDVKEIFCVKRESLAVLCRMSNKFA